LGIKNDLFRQKKTGEKRGGGEGKVYTERTVGEE